MEYGNKIKKKVEINDFLDFIKEHEIECTKHTFFRLSEAQRKIYTCDELKRIINEQRPFLVGIQHNGAYAVFYKYQNRIIKLIVGITSRKVNIVTFYFINEWQVPKL